MTSSTASDHNRRDPLPIPSAEEAESAPGSREIKAARNIVSRHIGGIPKRGYVMGDCDHAPILKGVADLTAMVYNLLDHLDPEPDAPSPLERETLDRIAVVRAMLEDHRCPPAA